MVLARAGCGQRAIALRQSCSASACPAVVSQAPIGTTTFVLLLPLARHSSPPLLPPPLPNQLITLPKLGVLKCNALPGLMGLPTPFPVPACTSVSILIALADHRSFPTTPFPFHTTSGKNTLGSPDKMGMVSPPLGSVEKIWLVRTSMMGKRGL